jgi:RNase P subunit RPR2
MIDENGEGDYEEGEEEIFTKEDFNKIIKAGDSVNNTRIRKRDPKRMRNLHQYKNLTDEEYEEKIAQLNLGITSNQEFEKRIQHKIKEFEADYDLSELNSNDKLVLRALCQAHITLEDLENQMYKIRESGISFDNMTLVEKLSKVMSDLRKDISAQQTDLAIVRKNRRNDKEASAINFIEDLKQKAKIFYREKMAYVFCTRCHTLLCTIWANYSDKDKAGKVTVVCQRELENGEICGEKNTYTFKELYDNKGSNTPEVLPESML